MRISPVSRIVIVALFSCVIAGCQSAIATNGSGYRFVRFYDPDAARAAAADVYAGPAINNNNRQCVQDKACRKD